MSKPKPKRFALQQEDGLFFGCDEDGAMWADEKIEEACWWPEEIARDWIDEWDDTLTMVEVKE